MILEIKLVTRCESTAGAGAMDRLVGRLFFLHANPSQVSALGWVQINARIVVDLVRRVSPDFNHGWVARHQTRTGSLEVIVGQRTFAGVQFLLDVPAGNDVLGVEIASRLVIVGDILSGARLVDGG